MMTMIGEDEEEGQMVNGERRHVSQQGSRMAIWVKDFTPAELAYSSAIDTSYSKQG
jgi:hypothetical protein